MTKKDADRLKAIRKELGDMALSYGEDGNTSLFLWEIKSRIGMFLAGHEKQAMDGMCSERDRVVHGHWRYDAEGHREWVSPNLRKRASLS